MEAGTLDVGVGIRKEHHFQDAPHIISRRIARVLLADKTSCSSDAMEARRRFCLHNPANDDLDLRNSYE